MEEIWKDIEGYPNYMVSNMGRVKSLNYHRTGREKILKPHKKRDGYLEVCLFKNGKRKYCLVHRLVAEAFIPNPNNLPFINHKSEIKSQNNVENLEYCDALYNNNYGTRKERAAEKRKGIYNTKVSKSVLQIDRYTKEIIREFPSTREIERVLGFKCAIISQCCNGKKYKSPYGFIWRYKEESVA